MYNLLELCEYLECILADYDLVVLVEIGQGCIGELLADTVLGEGVADTGKFIRIHRIAAYKEVVAHIHRVLVKNAVSGETAVKCGGCG